MSGAVRVNKTFPAESLTWEPMSIDLRSRWCKVMLRYYPIVFSPSIMGLIAQATNTNGWHTSADWIALAKEFDSLGFTPEEFKQLCDAVNADERSHPVWSHDLAGIDPDCAYVPNSLVTLSQGQSGRTCMRLRASDWVDYLTRVRAGEDAVAVVTETLAPHWGEPAEFIVT